MEKSEVIAKLIEFAATAYKTDAAALTEDTDLNAIGTSSVVRVAMAASIENEWDVMVPVAKFGKFNSIGALADYVIDEAE